MACDALPVAMFYIVNSVHFFSMEMRKEILDRNQVMQFSLGPNYISSTLTIIFPLYRQSYFFFIGMRKEILDRDLVMQISLGPTVGAQFPG